MSKDLVRGKIVAHGMRRAMQGSLWGKTRCGGRTRWATEDSIPGRVREISIEMTCLRDFPRWNELWRGRIYSWYTGAYISSYRVISRLLFFLVARACAKV